MKKILLHIFMVMCVVGALLPTSAMAADYHAKNEQVVYEYLINEMKVNPAVAAGIMVNIKHESRFDPDAGVLDVNGQNSYGICQWNGPRLKSLIAYCEEHDLDHTELEGQLAFLQYELEHGERSAYDKVKGMKNSAEGAYTAGYNWAKYFERCQQTINGVDQFELRGEAAVEYWEHRESISDKDGDPNCKHEELDYGYCTGCFARFAASVDGKLYRELKDAVKAAQNTETHEVLVLSDLKGENIKLEKAVLVIESPDVKEPWATVVEDCRFTGAQNAVLINRGKLVLKDVTVENKAGDYAVLCEAEATAEIIGGSYTAAYGVGVAGGTVRVGEVPTEFEAEAADIRMDGGMLELAGKSVKQSYVVENPMPGEFAVAVEAAAENVTADWIENISGEARFVDVNKSWTMSSDITKAVTADTEGLVYNGKEQPVSVAVELHGRQLVEGEDYVVLYPAANAKTVSIEDAEDQKLPKEAGKYQLVVMGMGAYTGEYAVSFEIKPAKPAVAWSAASERLTYTGDAAVLQSTASVALVEGENYSGKLAYSYRAAGKDGEFKSGLPTKAGSYEVKASVNAFGSYSAGETEAPLQLTIDKKSVAAPAMELPKVSGGYHFTGSAIMPVPVVKDGDEVISEGEYTVTYDNNVNVGTATVIVAGKADGNYAFANNLTQTFEIGKALQTALTIADLPETVVYGDAPFTLRTEGGSTVAEPVWSVVKGGKAVEVDEKTGEVTVKGVGEVTLRVVKAGNDSFEDAEAELVFTVQPATLTVSSAAAESKRFDGEKTVKITAVTLDGLKNGDNVTVSVDGLMGELTDSKAGSYTQVKLPALQPVGDAAANYTLNQPDSVKTDVKIEKAELPAALKEVEAKLPVGTEELIVENLGTVMPANAGALTYINKMQTTAEGTQAIVLKWGVDEKGTLTAQVANGKGGDKVMFDILIKSDNYQDAVLRIVTSIGAVELTDSMVTVSTEAAEITYNGQEQKPVLVVKYGDIVLKANEFEVEYPSNVTSAGEKEVTLTFKGAYAGTVKAKYTVQPAKLTVKDSKVKDKTFDGNTTATITVGTVSGAVKGDDVKVTAKGIFSDKNSGSRTVEVTYKVEGKAAANYVLETEKETLNGKINPITAAQLNSAIAGVTVGNATSDHRYAVQNVINQANTALQDTGLTAAEKTNITTVKESADAIIRRLDDAAVAASTDSIRATANVTASNVTMDNKAALDKAKTELGNALSTYGGNYTAAEEKVIRDKLTRVDAALEVVNHVQNVVTLVGSLPDDMTNPDASQSANIAAAKDAYNALTDYEKSLVGNDVKNKLTAAGLADTVVQPTPTPDTGDNATDDEGETEAPETINFPTWIIWVAVALASVCALGFVWLQIKKSREKNW